MRIVHTVKNLALIAFAYSHRKERGKFHSEEVYCGRDFLLMEIAIESDCVLVVHLGYSGFAAK